MTGHPPGAVNVPWQRAEGDRLVENPDFIHVMSRVFRTTDPLVIGCRSGARSHAACACLEQLGFSALVELRHGFEGARDAFGRRLPGWAQSGLPVEAGDAHGSYARLLAHVRGTEQG